MRYVAIVMLGTIGLFGCGGNRRQAEPAGARSGAGRSGTARAGRAATKEPAAPSAAKGAGSEVARTAAPPPRVQPTSRAGQPGGSPGAPSARTSSTEPRGTELVSDKQVPGRRCVELYESGSADFKAERYDAALSTLAAFVRGGCVGRLSATVDVWALYRGMLAACRDPNHRYLSSFQARLKEVCASRGAGSFPCRKGAVCPSQGPSPGLVCRDLYTKGSQAFKSQDMARAYDAFLEFARKGCFRRLKQNVHEWAAYRGVMAARALGRSDDAFRAAARRACRESRSWACRKLRGLHVVPR